MFVRYQPERNNWKKTCAETLRTSSSRGWWTLSTEEANRWSYWRRLKRIIMQSVGFTRAPRGARQRRWLFLFYVYKTKHTAKQTKKGEGASGSISKNRKKVVGTSIELKKRIIMTFSWLWRSSTLSRSQRAVTVCQRRRSRRDCPRRDYRYLLRSSIISTNSWKCWRSDSTVRTKNCSRGALFDPIVNVRNWLVITIGSFSSARPPRAMHSQPTTKDKQCVPSNRHLLEDIKREKIFSEIKRKGRLFCRTVRRFWTLAPMECHNILWAFADSSDPTRI